VRIALPTVGWQQELRKGKPRPLELPK